MKPRGLQLISIFVFGLVFCLAVPVMGQEPEIVGVWDYSSGKEDYKLIIAEEDGEMVMIKKFYNGIVIKQAVTINRRSDGVVYQPDDKDAEEYYLVNEAGDMQIWDVLGLKETIQADQ